MSTPLHVFLKADPSLEGNLAYDEADPSACHQLGQVSCSTNMCLERLNFLKKFLPQWLHCSGKKGSVASVR